LDALRAGGRQPAVPQSTVSELHSVPFHTRSTGAQRMTPEAILSRRTLLKGLGVTVALPWLESLPAWGEPAAVRAKAPLWLGCLSIADGLSPPHWWAKGRGAGMELGPSLEPLGPFREKINVINGLFNKEGDGGHARCTGNILSGAPLQRGRTIHGGV